MENTLKNKANFFGQNIGQCVHVYREGIADYKGIITGIQQNGIYYYIQYRPNGDGLLCLAEIPYCSVLQTPLSAITDEDAIEVGKIMGHKIFVGTKFIDNLIQGSWMQLPMNICANVIDYLRRRGYALPYLDASVEQQIEYGWVKLKIA